MRTGFVNFTVGLYEGQSGTIWDNMGHQCDIVHDCLSPKGEKRQSRTTEHVARPETFRDRKIAGEETSEMKQTKFWIGIDPGQTGAIALVFQDGGAICFDCPPDANMLTRLLYDIGHEYGDPMLCVIEQQQAMPGQGVVSMFKLGQNYGMWLASLSMKFWPHRAVRPSQWKSGLGYPPDKKLTKEHSLTLARRLFPNSVDQLTRKKDHGRAEALLLANLARVESGWGGW